jgi:hypothetical protein
MCEAVEPRRLLAAAPVGVARDTAFGSGGTVVTDLAEGPLSSGDYAFDAEALPGGDFVIVGAARNDAYASGAIARYNADGSVDTTFG